MAQNIVMAQSANGGGSIGMAWPPRYDGYNNRIKGFCSWPIENRSDAVLMFEAVREAERANLGSTRTTVRAFVRHGLLEDLRRAEPSYRVEARFDAGSAVEGYELIYLGKNAQGRMPQPAIIENELLSLREIDGICTTIPGMAQARVARAGYTLSRLNGYGRQEIGRLLELYQDAFQKYLFPLNEQTVGELVDSASIIIVGRDAGGRIISSLVAEHAPLAFGGKTVHLVELSEAATDRASRGHGLLTALYFRITELLREAYEPGNTIVYVEARAPWIPVSIATRRADFVRCGVLLQHCTIVGDRSPGMQYEGDYEDLSVWVGR